MTRWRWWLVAGLLALVAGQAAAAPPLRRWYTLRTACCDLTYHDGLEGDAPRWARAIQESHEAVTRFLGYAPGERTQFLLTDDTDSSNGSATPVPYNQVRLFARAPGSMSDLSDHDDWARALVVHEYTHIVHTDLIRGVPSLFNWVFGKTWPPNMLQPRWFIEGLAVFVETRMTTGGRARSSLFDMYLRTAALDGRLWDLDVLSSGGRAFPGGNGAYLYGGHFLTWIADHYGADVLRKVSHRYGGQALPYALSTALEEHTQGRGYRELYDAWRLDLTREALAVQARVEGEGRTPERRLTGLGQSVFYPRRLRDGALVFYGAPPDNSAGLYVARPRRGQAPEVVRLTEVQSVQGLSPTPDGRAVVFAQPELYATTYSYADLFRADLATGDVTRITAGARVRDPDVHPDGRTAIAVENRTGRSRLVLVDLATGAVRPVFGFPEVAEIHSPRFNARGDAVVFTAWRPGGFRDVYLLHPGAAEPRALTHDRAMDLHPAFNAAGDAVYFSSDRTGVYDIYRHDLRTGAQTRATRVVTGAFMPLPLEEEHALIYVGFGADAYDLAATPLFPAQLPPADPPPTRPAAAPLPAVATWGPEPYTPWETLWPRYWRPVIRVDSLFGLTLGATVSGEDLVGYHAYEADARVAIPSGDYAWSLAYRWTRLPLPVLLSASGALARTPSSALGNFVRGQLVEDVVRAEAGVSLPLFRYRVAHDVSVAYGMALRHRRTEPVLRPDGPAPRLPEQGPGGYLSLGYAYASTRAFRDSVSAERGRRVAVRARVGHPLLINREETLELDAEYREYLEVPLLARHVWHLAVFGGVARGAPWARRAYFLGGPPSFAFPAFAGAWLRGYPQYVLVGDGYLLVTAEWRFPLLELQQGFWTVPLFLDRVRGLVFLDQGLVFHDLPRLSQLRRGVGAELLLDVDAFYVVPVTLRLGVARGLDAGGVDLQAYGALGLGG
ncbi:MAG: hypothetical protein HY904_05875 [Deltaproteobacteria bacterium]|nr:hypothetical protein [Deltaproteobacteria bacterium]